MTSITQTEFIHSTPVPRIYKIASKIAKNVKDGKDSLKNLVYAEKHVNIKTVYALVVEAFKREEIIDGLIEKSQLLVKEPRFNLWLAKILISELLWGKNRMSKGSKPVDTILGYEKVLRTLLEDLDGSVQPVLKYTILKPRYVRVNTLKITTDEAVNNFRDECWIFVPFFNKSDYVGFQKRLDMLKPNEFMKDIHIPDLLIFPPKTEFFQHEAYKSGCIILQDKASCLPVHILAPTPGSIVLDTCAAPGMKTTQLAALLQNTGTVYAVELNQKRANLLKELVESASATCIKTILKDVMQVTADDCPDIEYILVDPSCSGSGITDRIEIEKLDLPTKLERLKKLCNFQAKLLRHTMCAFPKAKRIVYSTCSINSEENEDVVRQTLETSRHFKLVDAKKSLQSWNTKTSSLYPDLGNMCIFATPEEDKTNGFFVAVFERLQEGEKNPYLNYELCKFFDKESRKNKNLYDDQVRSFSEKKENCNRNDNTQENERRENSLKANEDYCNVETSFINSGYQKKSSDRKINKKNKMKYTTEETTMESMLNITNYQTIKSDVGSNEVPLVTSQEKQRDPSSQPKRKKNKNLHYENKILNETFPENSCSNECDAIEHKKKKKTKKNFEDKSGKSFSENSIEQNTLLIEVKKKHKKVSENTEVTIKLGTESENSTSNSFTLQTEEMKSVNFHKGEIIKKIIDDSIELDLSSTRTKKKKIFFKEQKENVEDSKQNENLEDSKLSIIKRKKKKEGSIKEENAINPLETINESTAEEKKKLKKKSYKGDKKTELPINQNELHFTEEVQESNEMKKNKTKSKDFVVKYQLASSNNEATNKITENTVVSDFKSDKTSSKKKRKNESSYEQGNVTDESLLEMPETLVSIMKAETNSIKTEINDESDQKEVAKKRKKTLSTANNDLKEPKSKKMKKI